MSHWDVEQIVSVDTRGQVVLPKAVREQFGLLGGGKLAVVVMRSAGTPCCISLMPVASLSKPVSEIIEPAFVPSSGPTTEGERNER
jgi:AbrB family looped-hinge helix DNA binding protein